jgi:hypothetical protein
MFLPAPVTWATLGIALKVFFQVASACSYPLMVFFGAWMRIVEQS